jgi:hypothetical protein
MGPAGRELQWGWGCSSGAVLRWGEDSYTMPYSHTAHDYLGLILGQRLANSIQLWHGWC